MPISLRGIQRDGGPAILGHSRRDLPYTRRDPPRGESFYCRSSIRQLLCLRRSRRVPVPDESRFFVRFLAEHCKPSPKEFVEAGPSAAESEDLEPITIPGDYRGGKIYD